tara:strand:- start:257 stop:454 length:198 start_codon:yes stop_codon:yes gene_type:complete
MKYFKNKTELKILKKIYKDDEELIFGNTFDDITSGPGGIEVPITLGELYEMNMTIQPPTRFFEDL